MKVKIITAEKKIKTCCKCGHNIFRKSKRSKYLNKEKTKGKTYDILVCDKCGHKEISNEIVWFKEVS